MKEFQNNIFYLEKTVIIILNFIRSVLQTLQKVNVLKLY